MKRRVLIAEDHPLVREGLTNLINHQPDLEVCGSVDAFGDVPAAVEALEPHLLLLDLWLTDGDAMPRIPGLKDRFPSLRILVLSQQDERLFAEHALRAGARGYIMKEQASQDVLGAIRSVLEGHVYVSAQIAARLAARFHHDLEPEASPECAALSGRELQVLRMMGGGLTTREIAGELALSIKTIETYREHLKHKLGLKDADELTLFAINRLQNAALLEPFRSKRDGAAALPI